jgi:transcriptional regulator with XRE-family HTH domain
VPRPNRGRSIASEANLAKRIAYERGSRGLSYEALASLMTEHGCPMRGSALYKIEKGDPPRRITVDELVALGRVLDVDLDELLVPMDLIQKRQARELIDELDRATEAVIEAGVRTFNVFTRLLGLEILQPEVREFVENRWVTASKTGYPLAVITADGKTATGDMRLHEVLQKLPDDIEALAKENVTQALESGKGVGWAVKGKAD